MAELVCPKHGYYDASYGSCPLCSGVANRPPAPMPLSEDDMPTDPGAIPGRYLSGRSLDDEAPTGMGLQKRTARLLDPGDDEKTDLGFRSRQDETELDVTDTSMMGLLWAKEGTRRGRTYKIKDGTVIGRSSGDVVLDDPKSSNPHAKFTIEDNQFTIWDFGSKNGTFVNGTRIRAATTLQENDSIRIGEMVFVLKILE